jgi:DNA-binding NtrC family response regulator
MSLLDRLNNLGTQYRQNLADLPVVVIGGTYLHCGLYTSDGCISTWTNTAEIDTMVWGSASSTAYTLSCYGYRPDLITAVPGQDNESSVICHIDNELNRQVSLWKNTSGNSIRPTTISLSGRCPMVQSLLSPPGWSMIMDPGCLNKLSWEHIISNLPTNLREKSGLLIIYSVLQTKLWEGLSEALTGAFPGWLVCMDFGRLDRNALHISEKCINTLREGLNSVDILFSSTHDLVELFHEDLHIPPGKHKDYTSALRSVKRCLLKHPSPSLVIIKKAPSQDRILLLRDEKAWKEQEYSYVGRSLKGHFYPQIGGIFNGAFLGGMLRLCGSSEGESTLPPDIYHEAMHGALTALCYCVDQYIEQRSDPEYMTNKTIQFPLETVVQTIKDRTDHPELDVFEYIRRYGWLEGLLGFSTCGKVIKQIKRAADTDQPIILEGETGSGKEFVFEYIHKKSQRADGPFYKINCTGLTESLLESELFGHVKGAFTGATTDKEGAFRQADGGTIFIDEIHRASIDLQMKLLRVLDDGTFTKVGSTKVEKVDVRVIVATQEDMKDMVDEHRFLIDLYFRIKNQVIKIPPLRERKKDIPILAEHFLRKYVQEKYKSDPIAHKIAGFHEKANRIMKDYPWPGNVRELESSVEFAVDSFIEEGSFGNQDNLILKEHLPSEVQSPSPTKADVPAEVWQAFSSHYDYRLLVHFWPQLRTILKKTIRSNDKPNWKEACRLCEDAQLPLTGKQIEVTLVKRILIELEECLNHSIVELLDFSQRELAERLLILLKSKGRA